MFVCSHFLPVNNGASHKNHAKARLSPSRHHDVCVWNVWKNENPSSPKNTPTKRAHHYYLLRTFPVLVRTFCWFEGGCVPPSKRPHLIDGVPFLMLCLAEGGGRCRRRPRNILSPLCAPSKQGKKSNPREGRFPSSPHHICIELLFI